jgi:hypothetical protein
MRSASHPRSPSGRHQSLQGRWQPKCQSEEVNALLMYRTYTSMIERMDKIGHAVIFACSVSCIRAVQSQPINPGTYCNSFAVTNISNLLSSDPSTVVDGTSCASFVSVCHNHVDNTCALSSQLRNSATGSCLDIVRMCRNHHHGLAHPGGNVQRLDLCCLQRTHASDDGGIRPELSARDVTRCRTRNELDVRR